MNGVKGEKEGLSELLVKKNRLLSRVAISVASRDLGSSQVATCTVSTCDVHCGSRGSSVFFFFLFSFFDFFLQTSITNSRIHISRTTSQATSFSSISCKTKNQKHNIFQKPDETNFFTLYTTSSFIYRRRHDLQPYGLTIIRVTERNILGSNLLESFKVWLKPLPIYLQIF